MLATASTVVVGTVITGGVVSVLELNGRTVTVKDPGALLPAASVAVQLTVVAPTGKALPDAGEQTAATAPETASVAVAV